VLIFAYAQILGYYNLKHECILYKKIKDYLKFEKKNTYTQCNAMQDGQKNPYTEGEK